jgi:hypothetical protein
MALIDRLIRRDAAGNKPVGAFPGHVFLWTLSERAQGGLGTNGAAQTVLETLSGQALDAGEQADALALLNWVMAASAATRHQRYLRLDSIVGLGQMAAPGYATPAEVRAKLVAAGALAA